MPRYRLDPASDEERDRIGRELNALRRAKSLTLADVAAATGKSAGYISHIEVGHKRPTPEMVAMLAAIYGVSPEDILGVAA